MALIPGFEYDIFISYARLDNDANSEDDYSWIEKFHDKLASYLDQRLGERNVIKLWYDRRAIDEATDFILQCLPLMVLGEIFVPKMPLYKIKDLAAKFSNKHKIIGLRQGEKMKEILISKDEEKIAETKKNMWVIRQYKKK